MSDKGFIWNPSNCECECDKSSDIGEYLDYKNCKCRNKLVNKLVEECIKNIDESEILYNETLDANLLNAVLLNDYKKVCDSCTRYIVFAVFFITRICMSSVFIYFHWCLKKDNVRFKFNPSIQATIY